MVQAPFKKPMRVLFQSSYSQRGHMIQSTFLSYGVYGHGKKRVENGCKQSAYTYRCKIAYKILCCRKCEKIYMLLTIMCV